MAFLIPIAIVLSVGISEAHLSKLYLFLFDHVPFFRGFREPFKFAQLLPLSYAFLGSIGVAGIARALAWRRARLAVLSVVLLVPLIYTYSMLFGFGGQLKSMDFPTDYHQVEKLLAEEKGEFSTLFFPWHGWMVYSWAGKTLGYQAQPIFPSPIAIRPDTMEVGTIYTQSANPVSHYIEAVLGHREDIDNLGELVSPLKVRYVVLQKEADWQEYDFLFRQKDLKLVTDLPTIMVFSNQYRGEVSHILSQAEDELELPSGLTNRVEAAVDSYGRKNSILLWPAISFIAFAGAIAYLYRHRNNYRGRIKK